MAKAKFPGKPSKTSQITRLRVSSKWDNSTSDPSRIVARETAFGLQLFNDNFPGDDEVSFSASISRLVALNVAISILSLLQIYKEIIVHLFCCRMKVILSGFRRLATPSNCVFSKENRIRLQIYPVWVPVTFPEIQNQSVVEKQ